MSTPKTSATTTTEDEAMNDEATKTTGSNPTLEDAQAVLNAARTERALRVACLRVERLETFMRTVAERVPTLAFEVHAALAFIDAVPLAVDPAQ